MKNICSSNILEMKQTFKKYMHTFRSSFIAQKDLNYNFSSNSGGIKVKAQEVFLICWAVYIRSALNSSRTRRPLTSLLKKEGD